MPIIKEKRIEVTSYIENLTPRGAIDGEAEVTKETSACFFKISEGLYEITYRTESEGGPIISDISIRDGVVTVSRRGALKSEIHFIEGAEDKSLYEIPPYSFDMTIYTKKIRISIDKDSARLDVFYRMSIGGADKNVRMKIEVL